MKLTQERLKELLHYDPDTGGWRWRASRRGVKVGVAGTINKGYRQIRIDGKIYKAARLAFLYMTGSWPKAEADHENTDPGNDRWKNLRDATRSQNNANKRVRCDSRTGVKGVDQLPSGKYRVQIKVDGRMIYLGTTSNLDFARRIYAANAAWYFGEFARAA